MSEVIVIGHRNPDTDSICSAVGYAEFKRRTGTAGVIAARCGNTNERIDFVLNYFGVPAPRFISDVSPRIRDVMQRNVVSAPPSMTAAEAMSLMDGRNIRVLPVLDEDRRCVGLVSVFKMCKFFFSARNTPFESRRVLASVERLTSALDGRLLHGVEADREEDLIMLVAAMTAKSFHERLPLFTPDRLIVVVGDRRDIQLISIDAGIRVLVVTGGLPVSIEVLDRARERGVSVVSSPHDTATTSMLTRGAIAIRHLVHEHFLSFRDEEPLAGVRDLATASNFQAFPVVDERDGVIGILSKSDFLKKVDRKLILVDHNELTQAVPGADQVEIVEVIDHHRIGPMTTREPILFHNEPIGSTSSIVADCFFRRQLEIPPPIAGLLLAGLVSDTLNLTSPTTTERDAIILSRLEKAAGVNATEFTEKLFASGSVLVSRSAGAAISTDCKEYEDSGWRFSVAQIEELGFGAFWQRLDQVRSALEAYRLNSRYDFSALLVTDVVRQVSVLLVAGPKSLLQRIDYPEVQPGIYRLEGVVSRKKQLLPYLTGCLGKSVAHGRGTSRDSEPSAAG